MKATADAQAACEVEEKELIRKVVIKGKEWATSETVENQSEPTSPTAPESNNEDKDLVLAGNSLRSILLNTDAVTSGKDVYEGLDLNAEQKSLCDLYSEIEEMNRQSTKNLVYLRAPRKKHHKLKKC